MGALLGLGRLMGAGTSVSDLLVRGKHIQPSITPSSSLLSKKGGGGEKAATKDQENVMKNE